MTFWVFEMNNLAGAPDFCYTKLCTACSSSDFFSIQIITDVTFKLACSAIKFVPNREQNIFKN